VIGTTDLLTDKTTLRTGNLYDLIQRNAGAFLGSIESLKDAQVDSNLCHCQLKRLSMNEYDWSSRNRIVH
jgi:hypothetical protein